MVAWTLLGLPAMWARVNGWVRGALLFGLVVLPSETSAEILEKFRCREVTAHSQLGALELEALNVLSMAQAALERAITLEKSVQRADHAQAYYWYLIAESLTRLAMSIDFEWETRAAEQGEQIQRGYSSTHSTEIQETSTAALGRLGRELPIPRIVLANTQSLTWLMSRNCIDLNEARASTKRATQAFVEELANAVMKADIERVRELLDRGADLNGRWILERTPLMLAVGGGRKDIVMLLLDYGADVTLTDAAGLDALSLLSGDVDPAIRIALQAADLR